MKKIICCLVILSLVLRSYSQTGKQRIFVLTDISTMTADKGEPDDTQSMIRLLMYGDIFDFEGFGATYTSHGDTVHPEYLEQLFDLYGKSLDQLKKYGDYPDAASLKDRVWAGSISIGTENIGAGHNTALSDNLAAAIMQPSDRQLWILVWGGSVDLAQALWQIREKGDSSSLGNVNIYAIGDQYDKCGDWIREHYPSLHYITNYYSFRGMYRTGDASLCSKEWVESNIKSIDAPLAQAYPIYEGGDPFGHVQGIKEGDSPSFLYLVDHRWGGVFRQEPGTMHFSDRSLGDTAKLAGNISRFRKDFQEDFAQRLKHLKGSPPLCQNPGQ